MPDPYLVKCNSYDTDVEAEPTLLCPPSNGKSGLVLVNTSGFTQNIADGSIHEASAAIVEHPAGAHSLGRHFPSPQPDQSDATPLSILQWQPCNASLTVQHWWISTRLLIVREHFGQVESSGGVS